jgi:predicted DNA-binding transcriptional regulator YafY
MSGFHGGQSALRQSRLLTILLLLNERKAVSAQALAARCEVSLRTIYRDMDALSAAGLPVYAERGASGGYRLLPGYRARVEHLLHSGLTAVEAAAFGFWGTPAVAAELGLGAPLAGVERKVMAALHPQVREQAGAIRGRFHLDAPGWYGDNDHPTHLEVVGDAVFHEQVLLVRYQRWKGEVTRTLQPLGLVLKGGAWYLVATADDQHRTYRVSRILTVNVLPQCFERPADFDLAAYWEAWSAEFMRSMYRAQAVVRLSPTGRALGPHLFERYVYEAVVASTTPPDADGWVQAVFPIESVEHAAYNMLRLGTEAEVLHHRPCAHGSPRWSCALPSATTR